MSDKQIPGPWQVRAWSSHAPTTVGVESTDRPGWFDVIAECSCFGARFTPEQEQANARLISAAPDLLEVVRSLIQSRDEVERGEHYFGESSEWNTRLAKMYADARAAITKAEGRS